MVNDLRIGYRILKSLTFTGKKMRLLMFLARQMDFTIHAHDPVSPELAVIIAADACGICFER